MVVNKWDIPEKDTGTLEKFRKKVLDDLKFMDYAPVLFISALTGQRVNTVLDAVDQAYAQTSKRIPTGLLNDVLGDAQSCPAAAHDRRPQAEGVLRHADFGLPPHLCAVCQR